jgi:hypothetical protein
MAVILALLSLTDGSFPNHTPNPEDKKAVAATTKAVLAAGADLGIMLDTDVDRSGVVDAAGNGGWGGWQDGCVDDRAGLCGCGALVAPDGQAAGDFER